jgi:HD-GYP domain-containing protein (c-di-GMP phosphodiesterase class II)
MTETFFPIRLNTLRGDEVVSFDIYLQLGTRFLHYTHRSDSVEDRRLKNLKSKGVRKLFIRSEDEKNYLRYLEKGLENLSDKSKDISQRGAMAHDALVMAAENAERTLETQEGFNNQKKQFDKISNFIVSDRHAIKNILAAAGVSVDNSHHAANVSSLAVAVATKAGITDSTEIFELGTAALLHDIGKNRLKFDHMKPREKMTPEELKKFKQHPQDGVDMLAGKPYISPRILGLILSHEEYGEGRGFPEKKNLSTMPLPYQILSMVNHFDHFASENKMSFITAVDHFFEKYGDHFDQQLITILASVLT